MLTPCYCMCLLGLLQKEEEEEIEILIYLLTLLSQHITVKVPSISMLSGAQFLPFLSY